MPYCCGGMLNTAQSSQPCTARLIITWFVDQVTEACCTGDADKSKALLAMEFKLLGNSAYGKMIEAVEHQTYMICTKDEKVVDH